MFFESGNVRTVTLCAAVALGALGTATAPASAHYYTTRCDRYGDCYRALCDNDGDDCYRAHNYYHRYYRPHYRPRYYGYGYGYSHPSYNIGIYGSNGSYGSWHHDEDDDD